MSTNSFIGMQHPETGFIVGVYCHHDGYPDGVGQMLLDNYTDPMKVKALIALGSLSYLAEKIGEEHDFDKPVDGWTLAHNRDRGDLFRQVTANSIDRLDNSFAFLYLFVDGQWKYRAGLDRRWHSL